MTVDVTQETPIPPEPVTPNLVVIIEDDAPVDRARLVRIAERGPDVGVHVIWCASNIAALPAACRTYVSVEESVEGASAGHVRVGERFYPVTVETVSVEVASGVARHLSPVVNAGVPIDDDSDLPGRSPISSSVACRWPRTPTTSSSAGRRTTPSPRATAPSRSAASTTPTCVG